LSARRLRDGRRWRPSSPDRLPADLARHLAEYSGVVRVAVDGAPCARPDVLAEALLDPLRTLGRPAVHLRSASFWKDASLRFEYGREDTDSYPDWVDAAALQREVLTPVLASGHYLPSLRDPVTNRSTREAARSAGPDTVLIVSGELLLGLGLEFDRAVHLQLSAAARARRTPEQDAWTLPAFDRYDAEVEPSEVADMVIRVDDPLHPAVAW
jgi:hypothetical protein